MNVSYSPYALSYFWPPNPHNEIKLRRVTLPKMPAGDFKGAVSGKKYGVYTVAEDQITNFKENVNEAHAYQLLAIPPC